MKKGFVVACVMRCGGMELARRLDQHSKVKCILEAEHPASRKGEELLVEYQNPFNNLHQFTRDLLDAMRKKYPDIPWLGNKSICMNHSAGNAAVGKPMDELLADGDILKAIHFRKNLVRSLISLEYMRNKGKLDKADLNYFHERCVAIGNRVVEVCRFMSSSGQNWSVTTYDMLPTREAERRIFSLLGLRPHGNACGPGPNKGDVYAGIENRDELEKMLAKDFGSTLGNEEGDWGAFWPADIKRLLK